MKGIFSLRRGWLFVGTARSWFSEWSASIWQLTRLGVAAYFAPCLPRGDCSRPDQPILEGNYSKNLSTLSMCA
jgi:hypothetical protein